jgi:hypothetical protein
MPILCLLLFVIAIQATLALIVSTFIKWIIQTAKEIRLNQAHQKALHIRPERGQVWIQDGEEDNEIYIQDICEDGAVVLTTAHPVYAGKRAKSWRDTPERWRERVANRRLIQVRSDLF